MEPSLHIVCPHCDTINRVPRAKLDKPEAAAAAAANAMRRCSTGTRSRSTRRASSVIWRKAASRC